MPVEEVIKTDEKRNVLVGIRIDNYSRDLLSWALVKVAEPGDCVVAIHVCRNSDQASKSKPLLDTYLEVYKGLCSARKVDLIGKIFSGSSVRRILVREAKNYAAIALVVGMSRRNKLGRWSSPARYCTKRLPPTTDVLAIHNGKIVFGKGKNNHLLPGVNGDPRPSLCSTENISPREINSEFGDSEADTEKSSFALCLNSEDETRDSDTDSKYRSISFGNDRRRMSLRSSFLAEDIMEHRPGWPLLARASLGTLEAKLARNLSVVQWVMHLPDRSPQQSPRFSTIEEKAPLERQMSCIVDESIRHSSLDELRDGLRILLETNSSSFKWFSYEVLKSATSQFSSENMIGKGGCNRVYKGILPDGKRVAVKIMQSSREAWKDFAREVDIISSVEHRHITPLLGVCIEDTDLISVYEFLSKGSLEEYLHGKLKDKQVLSWEVRFKVAVGIAEALNYLHNECSRPVIHRDVKTSNILLSDRFQPQLSDFGLAIWGPTSSSYLTEVDVVGTFGYLAPEYFMYGKVSDKIDIYAFGVVLLELLSGRKPIGSEASKGQESLVMWAKPMIENGNVKNLLDPNLKGKINEVQMQRMVLATTRCITRAARLRPKMREVLNLLKGDTDSAKWVNSPIKEENEDLDNQDVNDDEVYPHSSAELHLGLAFLDVDDDSTSFSSLDRSNILSFEDYLKGRWSRSSSFN
ncbi:probable receptor-like serine/threonine-protein kinase At5g57670 [Pistacia vera]|uniref:probable receptor-like serine/threonine-protein kinase At5g57670 n=1 Tax=Pistacia vera TaxID=55513 RepID=UPI001262D252|nr:probable receptor-like serine/threonine-protein kinase At5g57670 [Pistacia vera]